MRVRYAFGAARGVGSRMLRERRDVRSRVLRERRAVRLRVLRERHGWSAGAAGMRRMRYAEALLVNDRWEFTETIFKITVFSK